MTRYLAITLALLLIVLCWQYNANIELSNNLATTQQTANNQQATIGELQTQKTQLNKSQRALAADLQQNKAAVLKQIKKLRELENENQHYKEWANKPIPTAVIGLQQRPTITGSEHYQQYLRNRNPLPTKPDPTHHQQ
jgi:LysB family phage lysis regulatory protein